jgi:hypothetical protein
LFWRLEPAYGEQILRSSSKVSLSACFLTVSGSEISCTFYLPSGTVRVNNKILLLGNLWG